MRFSRNGYLRTPNSPSFPDFHCERTRKGEREREREKRLSRVISRETTKSIQRWWNISGRRARDKLSPRPQLILAAERRLIASRTTPDAILYCPSAEPPPSRLLAFTRRFRFLSSALLSSRNRHRIFSTQIQRKIRSFSRWNRVILGSGRWFDRSIVAINLVECFEILLFFSLRSQHDRCIKIETRISSWSSSRLKISIINKDLLYNFSSRNYVTWHSIESNGENFVLGRIIAWN